jgi:hypothetical protein
MEPSGVDTGGFCLAPPATTFRLRHDTGRARVRIVTGNTGLRLGVGLRAALLLVGLMRDVAAQAAGGSIPGLPDAVARLQAGDPAGAITILDAVTTREPGNARAWRVLGQAARQAARFDRALEAYGRAAELEPASGIAPLALASLHALRRDTAAALEWLAKAKATRNVDLTQIQVDTAWNTLLRDPRVVALLPRREDFANPFVEPVRIVREWVGESTNDQFGWIARNLGDVDGDGVNDVVTSAPTKQVKGTVAGRVYVYSTKTGRLVWQVDGEPGARLGIGVEAAGDADRDGVPDVIASAPGTGKAYVYSGRDGRVLLTLTAEALSDTFGRHVSGVGDIDRDGHADVMVGAPGNAAGGANAGRAYVYSGRDGRVLLTLTGERAGDAFGSTVAGHTRGNRSVLIVGAPGAGPDGRRRGRTYVYAGLDTAPRFVIGADETGSALGAMFVSAVGDLDADGIADIYASDFSNTAKGPSTGRVYLHSGADGRRLFTLTGETPGEGFGIGPANAGDVDGDGHDDLIVGAWQYAGAASSGGRATLFSGKDGRVLRTYTSRIPGDTFGFDAVGMGDVDGDGTLDFLITSAWSGVSGFHSGRMFVISSGVRAIR